MNRREFWFRLAIIVASAGFVLLNLADAFEGDASSAFIVGWNGMAFVLVGIETLVDR